MIFEEATRAYEAEQTPEKLDEVTQRLVCELSLKEKCALLSGNSFGTTVLNVFRYGRVYNATPYGAGGNKRLKIPKLMFADGPRGVVLRHSTCFPVSMLRGATFDDRLEYRVGEAFAKEAIAGGANYFAGICINLLRNPRWGRAQETYSEDQYLLGRMGAALTMAVQDYGMMACPKHFACNSIEDLRFSVNVKADARTLREVYLYHFQKCIDAGALSVMGAYNKLNGAYCCENKELLTDILRGEMGFDGVVTSDFVFGVYDAKRSLESGMDVEMPYTLRFAGLARKVKKGLIEEKYINAAAKNMISALLRSIPKLKPQPQSVIVCDEHKALAREVAAKGTVLLKNKNGVLPLPKSTNIAVIGRYADRINTGDHGSSKVHSPYTVTPYQGISARFTGQVICYHGKNVKKALKTARLADAVIVCVGSDYKQEGEFLVNFGKIKHKPKGMGGDRTSLRLPKEDVVLIKALSALGKRLIVNIMGGSAYVIEEWLDDADAILHSFYSGLEGGNALADIISGDINPSGKLPFTVAKCEEDYPDFASIGDGKYDIEYGYYHGYALFEKKGVAPRYPFGYGLSYTAFSMGGLKAERKGDAVIVTLTVKNTGITKGATVAQIYAGSLGSTCERPLKQLKGFQRVELEAGGEAEIQIEIPWKDLRFYDPDTKTWIFDSAYRFFAGEDVLSANALTVNISF